ncbi:MAG: Gfo/Idh/MocA family oxidoreductase [Armatimonadetes bacterium]|nr:Gfo/Idh/MocA family oxidoreductase [Armatimonadota bacterium]
MKTAFIGVGHWHASEFYLPALLDRGVEIVAISDASSEAVERVAARFELDCPGYTDFRKLLDDVECDLVFASAPHADMTEIAAELVMREQPFHMEKPMGVDWHMLQPIAARAEQKNLFVSVALVSRYTGVVTKLRAMREADELGRPVHYYYRLLAGSPQRYLDTHCEWMLDPVRAGAGPLFNFGPHVVDLFIHLIDEVGEVTARWSDGVYGNDIEDHTTVLMVGRNTGAIGVGEVGYTMPDGYERYFSVTTDALHIGGRLADQDILMRDGTVEHAGGPDTTGIYDYYVGDTLRRFEAGEPPIATISDMVPVLRVMNAAAQSAREGTTVALD